MAGDQDRERRSGAVTRRDLLGRGAGLSAAGVAAGAASVAAGVDEAEPPDDPKRLTYRETDHIRAFYRRSRI